ncbi:MAG: hypothetical protein QXS76_02625 [Candidatus Bathyarchaeia archaeon]
MEVDHRVAIRAFEKAREELYCPPCSLRIIKDGSQGDASRDSFQPILNGVVYLDPREAYRSINPEEFMLWSFRHDLSHAHYCPYDIRTAYELERVALSACNDSELAFLALLLFCDLQVDCIYLRNRFHSTPFHLEERFRRNPPRGIERLFYATYRIFYPEIRTYNVPKEFEAYVGLLAGAIQSPQPWRDKIRSIATLLAKLRGRSPGTFSPSAIRRFYLGMGGRTVAVREDFEPNAIRRISEVLEGIESRDEAKAFYEHWLKPRISRREKWKGRIASGYRKVHEKNGKGAEGGGYRGVGEGMEEKEGKLEGEGGGGGRESSHGYEGFQEPSKAEEKVLGASYALPSGIGKERYLARLLAEDSIWKRLWYRARAEGSLMKFLAEGIHRRPRWTVLSYPDEWLIEDEIEDLDLETSMEEGPFIPEVTTIKWQNRPLGSMEGPIPGYVPSVITILDSSRSMANAFDEASTAAYIAHLSAAWAGGDTATISFSTDYVQAGWDEDPESKELVLTIHFGGLTILPAIAIRNLVRQAGGPCFIVIITDGGWQNIEEADQVLKVLGEQGHRIVIFHLYGWDYPEEVKKLRSNPYLTLYPVQNPSQELRDMVLREAMRTYERFF